MTGPLVQKGTKFRANFPVVLIVGLGTVAVAFDEHGSYLRGMSMRKAYYTVRALGYLSGVLAVLMVLLGGQTEYGYADEIKMAGYGLVLLTMVLFGVSYVLFGLMRKNSKNR